MLNNAGLALMEALPDSKYFLMAMKGLRKSESAKVLWKEKFGTAYPDGSVNRWFYWYPFVKAMQENWGGISGFVKACQEEKYMPSKIAKMEYVTNPAHQRRKLTVGLELVLLEQLGGGLATATYYLEGDGFLSPYAWRMITRVRNTVTELVADQDDNAILLLLREFAAKHKGTLRDAERDVLIAEVWKKRTVLSDYFATSISRTMSAQLELFKGLSVLDPEQFVAMTATEVVARLGGLVAGEQLVQGKDRRVKGLKGFDLRIRTLLVAEMMVYKGHAEPFAAKLAAMKPNERPYALWQWWWTLRSEQGMVTWFQLACQAVLLQPSSATIERFFSVVKGRTSAQQTNEDAETLETRAMAMWNESYE